MDTNTLPLIVEAAPTPQAGVVFRCPGNGHGARRRRWGGRRDVSSSATTPQVAIGRAPTGPECTVDFGYLAAELETIPADVRVGVIAALSPATQQLVDIALADEANTAVGGRLYGFKYTTPVPDGATLDRILAEIPAGDARAVESGLSPETLTAMGTPEPGHVASGPACP